MTLCTSVSDAMIRLLDIVLWFNCNFQAEITVVKEILPKREREREREKCVVCVLRDCSTLGYIAGFYWCIRLNTTKLFERTHECGCKIEVWYLPHQNPQIQHTIFILHVVTVFSHICRITVLLLKVIFSPWTH